MTLLVNLSKTLAAASANSICASQTPSGAGTLTLTTASGVTLDTQRRVLITCVGNNSGVTFTITGTRANGTAVSETITGPNATTGQSLYDYLTVTSVTISGASTGAVTVGTSSVGSTDWKNVESRIPSFSMSGIFTPSGTVTYTVELTNSHYLTLPAVNPSLINVIPASSALTSATTQQLWTPAAVMHAWRITVNSGTGTIYGDVIISGQS